MATQQAFSPPSSDDLPYWLALWRAPDIGPIKFIKLHQLFPKLADLFNAQIDIWHEFNLNQNLCNYLQAPDWAAVEKDLNWANQQGNAIMTYLDDDYPTLLKEINSAPPLLFIQGNRRLLATPQLAIVGSRHPTVIGTENAYRFASHLAQCGLTITSGLAMGIDAASHRGALSSTGATIAVMGTGLDSIYPKQNRFLAAEIAQKGILVSEFPIGTIAAATNFPRRNRIISGLSLGVFIVEAALSSGSLITAQMALDQGREVFAMPGSIHNPLSRGCHVLLRLGAKLVESVTDILEELGPLSAVCLSYKQSASAINSNASLTAEAQLLIDSIDFAATHIDLIVARSGLTASVVSSMLLHLELQGLVSAVPGGYIRLPQ